MSDDQETRDCKDFRFLLRIIDERDRQYNIRFDASEKLVEAELRALVDSRHAMMESFKAAVAKAEQAQDAWNETHNGLVRKMEDRDHQMMRRDEALGKFEDLKAAISALQINRGMQAGKTAGLNTGWGYIVGGVVLLATITNLIFLFIERASK